MLQSSCYVQPLRLTVAFSAMAVMFHPLTSGRAFPLERLQETKADSSRQSQNPRDIRNLELGKPIEREMKGGESHTYELTLEAGQYLNAVVDQRGIDVVVRVVAPGGKQIMEVDSPNGTQGPEPLQCIAEGTGNYQIRVTSLEKEGAPGKYEIWITALRAATEDDRAIAEAAKLDRDVAKLVSGRRYDLALPEAERSLALREKVFGPVHAGVAESLNQLAGLYKAKGELAKAEPLYQRALTVQEKVFGPEHSKVADALIALGTLYFTKGEWGKAALLFERVLAIREKVFGPEHPEVASTLDDLAAIYASNGDFAKSELLYQRALTIREKRFGPEHPEVATAFAHLSRLYRFKYEQAKAELLCHRALSIREKVFGPDSLEVAQSLDYLGEILHSKGDYSKAVPVIQRALAIREKVLGPEHFNLAQPLNNLASVYKSKGDYAKTEPLYLRVLALTEKAVGPATIGMAHVLHNLALLYYHTGEYAKAEAMNQRALAIRERLLGPEHIQTAYSLLNLAMLYIETNDFDKAEPLAQRAVTIEEKATDREISVSTLLVLASVYQAQGNYAKAETLLQRALTIAEKRFGGENPGVVPALNNLAALYQEKGETAKAVLLQTRASEVWEHHVALNIATGSERQNLAFMASMAGHVNRTISLHAQNSTDGLSARRLALVTVLRHKGRALDAMTDSMAVLRHRLDQQDLTLIDQLTEARSRLVALVLKGPGRTTPADFQAEIKRLEEQIEKLESQISARSAEFRAQSQPITLATVQTAIPADAALVEFTTYRPFNPKAAKREERLGKLHYVAYALPHTGEPLWVELGEAKPIDDAINSLRAVLRRDEDKPLSNIDRDVTPLARKVDEMVMRPVRKLLGNTRHVFISPDGLLNVVPFAALVDEKGRYLVKRYHFTYLASGRDLLRLQEHLPSKEGMLIMANPDYGPMSTEAAGRGLKTTKPQVVQKTKTTDTAPKEATTGERN